MLDAIAPAATKTGACASTDRVIGDVTLSLGKVYIQLGGSGKNFQNACGSSRSRPPQLPVSHPFAASSSCLQRDAQKRPTVCERFLQLSDMLLCDVLNRWRFHIAAELSNPALSLVLIISSSLPLQQSFEFQCLDWLAWSELHVFLKLYVNIIANRCSMAQCFRATMESETSILQKKD